MPTAYENELEQTAALPPAQKTAVAASVPGKMSPGFDTRGMTTAEVANQTAWMMQPRWHKQYELKNRYRGMTDLQRVQAINGLAARHNALSGLGGDPLDENRISLRVPTGGTADQHIALDYDKLNPEARLLYDNATKQFNREFTGLMSGSDASAWKSDDDYEKAVNNLQSVRDYGHMIEGHIFGTARRFLSPAMKVRFDANDRTFDSFKRWFDEVGKQGASGNDSAESLWADNDSAWAKSIKERFWQDPNYEKYRERNGKLEQVPVSPEQQRRAQLKAQRESGELERQSAVVNSQATLEQMTPQERELWHVNQQSGKLERKATVYPSREEQEAEIKRAGGNIDDYQWKYSATGKGFFAPKTIDRTAMKNEARAEALIERGFPIAADGDGNPIITSYKDNVQLFDKETGAAITPKLASLQNPEQMVAEGKWEYRLKGNMKPWTPSQGATASPSQQPSTPAAKSAPPVNAKGWRIHRDAKGNMAYVSPDGKQFEEIK